MSRARNTLVAAALVVAMFASACSALSSATQSPSTPGVPDPANAILLSVPSDTVYMVDPDSGAVAVVANNLTDFQAGYASWAPNHARYAYGQAGILVGRPGSTTVATVIKGQLNSMPSWSGNGKQIVFGNGVGMFIKTLGTGRADHVILPPTVPPIAPFSFDWGRGSTIAFEGLALTCEGTPTCMSAGDSDIYTVSSDGANIDRLTKVRTATAPKWSADYTRILFVRLTGKKKKINHQLWTVKPNGTDMNRLLNVNNVVSADWSPDGKRLVVVRTQGSEAANPQLQVWVGNSDGTGLHLLIDGLPGADASVDW
jgi:Tol biopolymer transport system component